MRYKRIGYNVDIMRQSACLVVNTIMVNNFAVLFAGGSGFRLFDSPKIKLTIWLVGAGQCLFLGPSGSSWWSSFAPAFQWCF